MAFQAANDADLVTTTLRDLGRAKWTDNSTSYRRTIALKQIINKKKTNFDSGYEVQFNRMVGLSNAARSVGLGAVDIVDITTQMGTGNCPWRHVTWNWAWDFREPLMNNSPAKIVDLIKTRRVAAMGSAIELFERMLWRAPASTDDVSIFGIPYWVVKSNTSATLANNNGFNGLSPATSTNVGGINPNTDTRWRNYATQYTTVSKDDLIRKARRMAEYTDFRPIVDDVPDYDTGDKTEFYTNYAVSGTLIEILESQNENLGKDVAPYEGQATFLRTLINVVPELDADTTNPFYQINWGVMGAIGLKGAWMKETNVAQVPGQHTMSATHTDCTLNIICRDRRKCGVLATDTSMPA
jgi:hypothetical protein